MWITFSPGEGAIIAGQTSSLGIHAARASESAGAGYRLKDRGTRLREAGMVSLDEVAEKFGVNAWVIKSRRLRGQLPIASHRLDNQGQYIYERPAPGLSLQCRRSPTRVNEVQNA